VYDAWVRATRLIGLFALVLAGRVSAERGLADGPLDEVDGNDVVVNPAFPNENNESETAAPDAGVSGKETSFIQRADLAPYFLEGRLREARQAFSQGLYARVRQKLEGVDDSNPVRFLRALAAFRARDFVIAATEFEALADTYPALAARSLVHAGWAYEGQYDFEAAIRVFARVSSHSRLFADAQLGLARAWRKTNEVPQAIAALERLGEKPAPPWGRDVGAEALLALADLQQALGNSKAEQVALADLWARHPLSAQAIKHAKRLLSVERLPIEVRVTRAEQLIEGHQNAQGLAQVEPLLESLKLPDATACRAHFAAGKAHRKLRSHLRAVAELGPVVERCTDPDLRAKALFTLGFSQTITAPEAARQTYEALAQEYSDHTLADDALFFAADLRMRAGDLDGANDRLSELADRFPLSDMGADGLFQLFWLRRAQGDREGSLEVLSEIEERFGHVDESHDVERARYWRARVLEESGKSSEAVEVLASNAAEHPATYYGLLSRERAELLAPSRTRAFQRAVTAASRVDDVFPLPVTELSDDQHFQSAVELLRMGFGDQVPMEILGIDRAKVPTESLRLLVVMLAMAGQDRSAHGMARLWLRRDLSGPITPKTRSFWEIAYPKAFREHVEASSLEADGLDADLLQALMREESGLDPKALSSAGALGLCQLMPSTAAEVAAKLKLPRPNTAALLQPDLNIKLGSRYLADLMRRFEGMKPFAVASYNAGPGAVSRWQKERPPDDLAGWVEQIPLQETRNYVKRVLRSYNTYKLLFSPDDVARTVTPVPPQKPKKADKKV
jgi:soluble lytic murein transglycosylase